MCEMMQVLDRRNSWLGATYVDQSYKVLMILMAVQLRGGSVGAPALERYRDALCEMGIENELYDQVLDGIKKDVVEKKKLDIDDGRVLDESVIILGSKMKSRAITDQVKNKKISTCVRILAQHYVI